MPQNSGLFAVYVAFLLATSLLELSAAFSGLLDDDENSDVRKLLIFGTVAGLLG